MTRSTAPGKSAAQAAKAHAPKATIWTLQVQFGRCWRAMLEMDSSASLYDLHYAIQVAAHLDGDHRYQFYAAKTQRGRPDGVFGDLNTTLADVFPLPEGHRLYYMFDFGNSWFFSIRRTSAEPRVPLSARQYPHFLVIAGHMPQQYPDGEDGE